MMDLLSTPADDTAALRHHDAATCPCCRPALDRRRVLTGAGAVAALLALPWRRVLAAGGNYEAMVLGCIDPRLQEPVHHYLAGRGLIGQFSQFTIAGAAIGVVAPRFADWHKAFWDNLAVTIELHNIKRVIAIDHRDCGAAKVAYGDASIATPDVETETHRRVLAQFRAEVGRRQPRLTVETGLMALNGSMLTFS